MMSTAEERLADVVRVTRQMRISLEGKERRLREELTALGGDAAANLARLRDFGLPEPIELGERAARIAAKFEAVVALREWVAALERAAGEVGHE